MKTGQAKQAYGMTAAQARQLRSIGKSDEIRKSTAALAFFNATRAYVNNARDLARSGKKDAARDWHRYFSNARVCEMLSAHSAVEDSSLAKFESEIKDLGLECHPEDVPDWSTDIAAIRASLEIIVKNLAVSAQHVPPAASLTRSQADTAFHSPASRAGVMLGT